MNDCFYNDNFISGRTGGFCIGCSASKKDVHDVEKISHGFYLDVGIEELWSTFKKLASDHEIPSSDWNDWVIPSEKGDYAQRLGLKAAPMTSEVEVTKIMSILHAARLNAFTWVQDLIIRWASKCLQWGAGTIPPTVKSRLEKCELEWKENLGPLVGFKDRHCPNQVTGAMADLFFSEQNRSKVVDAVENLSFWKKSYRREMFESEKLNLVRLLQGLSVLGRVGTSGHLVQVLKLRRFSIDLHIFIQESWSWILLGESVHRFFKIMTVLYIKSSSFSLD